MFIFSIYLFLLPGIACAWDDDCKDELETVVTKAADHEDHEKEDCGNFCTCSCCIHIVSVNFQSPGIFIEKPIVPNIKLSFYHNISLPSNYFGNIWQPPKMD